jgi:hypothetical protein
VTSDDPYRRNPARDLEKLAVSVVTSWVGETGVVTDTSPGGGPDFEIAYSDGRTAVGEVGWHEDPEIRAMWGNTFKQERHQTVELDSGRGTWSVHLLRGASINRLHKELPSLIDILIDASCFTLEVTDHWPHGPVADRARGLGIEYVTRHDGGTSDCAIYFMPGDGGVVPTDPNVVAEWIESVLSDPSYADTTAKLLAVDSDERHVFLMSGSATPFGAGERLRRVSEGLPTRHLNVPSGITHVWALSQFGPAAVALWTDHGWTLVSVPLDE